MFGKSAGAGAFQQERQLLRTNLFAAGTADMAVRADPGLHPVFAGAGIGPDNNRAAGVIFRDLRNQPGVPGQRIRRFAVDRQVHERSAGQGAVALSQSFFSSLPIFPISTGSPSETVASGIGHSLRLL